MPSKLQTVFEQIKTFWGGLSTPKRLAFVTLTVGALVAVLVVTTIGSRPTLGYLYTDLSTEDAGAIVQKLDGLKVPHQLDNGGTAIKVPEERVHALRLELAAAGLPRGAGVGFELFDKSQIGATEFEQNVNLRRAMEGELARSIATVEGVHNARVHLVMPERRLFAARGESASASVVLKLRNAGAFGKREVAAVVHLVSAAVPGLGRDRVSVVSTEGLTLHRPNSDATGVGDLADAHTEHSRAVASQLEAHVREQLERVVGPGNADVRMSVALDGRSKERTEEHYEPSKTALRSEHKVEEGAGAEEAGVAGVPGARSNLPDAVVPDTAPPEEALAGQPAGAGGGTRRTHTRNWEVDKVTEKTLTPPGGIERLSVAVLLNGRYEDRDGAQVYVGRSKAELAKLEQVVKSAVGFSAARGDSVELQTLEFTRMDGEQPPTAPVGPWWMTHWKLLAAAVGAAVMLLATVILVWRRKRAKKKAAALSKRKAQALSQGEVPVASLGAGATGEGELSPVEALLDGVALKSQALELAAHDPATAAVVLRRWLNAPSAAGTPARS